MRETAGASEVSAEVMTRSRMWFLSLVKYNRSIVKAEVHVQYIKRVPNTQPTEYSKYNILNF